MFGGSSIDKGHPPGTKVIRVVLSQVGGQMRTEAEAPDQQTLEKFLEVHHVNCEWIIGIDLDAQAKGITEYCLPGSHPLVAVRVKRDLAPRVFFFEGEVSLQDPFVPNVRRFQLAMREPD